MSLKKIKIDKFETIRWSIIFVLSLIIAHLFGYGKLPLTSGYKFPWRTLGVALIFGATICQMNTTIYRRLNKSLILKENLHKRILLQFIYIWVASIILFTILFLGINGVLLKKTITFYNYSFFLIIILFISTFEGLVFILLEVYKFYKSNQKNNENIIEEVKITENNFLTIKTVGNITNLSIDNIGYVNSKNGIVIIKDLDKKKYITQFTSLNEIIDVFPQSTFFRVNRQFLLNRNVIKKLEDDINRKLNVYLKDEFLKSNPVLSCSRYKSKEMRDWFNKEEAN
jgi:DNA-binding LytR/AlgR family response regulator